MRRVTKCETREIKKRKSSDECRSMTNFFSLVGLEPIIPVAIKSVRVRVARARPKPATLVKAQLSSRVDRTTEHCVLEVEQRSKTPICPSSVPRPSNPARILQCNDLQKLSRLSCSHEFSLFHKEMKGELRSNEHQLAFFQTKLNHLKNEFVNQMSQQLNLQEIRDYFAQALQKNVDRRIKPDEFLTLADKLKQDIKQVRYLLSGRSQRRSYAHLSLGN